MKSTDCLLLVTVVLAFAFDSSKFLPRLITLMACFPFLPFFWPPPFCVALCDLDAELAACTNGIDAAYELSC